MQICLLQRIAIKMHVSYFNPPKQKIRNGTGYNSFSNKLKHSRMDHEIHIP